MGFIAGGPFIMCHMLSGPSLQINFSSSPSFLFRIAHKDSASYLPLFVINKVIIADWYLVAFMTWILGLERILAFLCFINQTAAAAFVLTTSIVNYCSINFNWTDLELQSQKHFAVDFSWKCFTMQQVLSCLFHYWKNPRHFIIVLAIGYY
jgi:hypothetical protein